VLPLSPFSICNGPWHPLYSAYVLDSPHVQPLSRSSLVFPLDRWTDMTEFITFLAKMVGKNFKCLETNGLMDLFYHHLRNHIFSLQFLNNTLN